MNIWRCSLKLEFSWLGTLWPVRRIRWGLLAYSPATRRHASHHFRSHYLDGRTDGRADGVSRVALIAVAAVHNRGERRRGKKWSHERNRKTFARCDSTVGRTSSGAVRARAVAWRGITTRRRQASATQHCGDFLLLEVPRRDFIST